MYDNMIQNHLQDTESILFIGDVVLDRPYDAKILTHPCIVYNFEGPVADGETPRTDTWNLHVSDCFIRETFGALPIAVSLANNHIMDYGIEALDRTQAILQSLDIRYFGVGTHYDHYGNPFVLNFGSLSVGILGYAAADTGALLGNETRIGAAPLSLPQINDDIHRLKSEGINRVIVFPHWGHEHISLPSPDVVNCAHQIIDAGADLIIGNHAHRIQAFESYHGCRIYYGLGNCIFGPCKVTRHDSNNMSKPYRVRLSFEKHQRQSLSLQYFPRTGMVSCQWFHFDGKRVKMISGIMEDITAKTADINCYQRFYASRALKELTLYRIFSFYHNPDPSRIIHFVRTILKQK